MEIELKYAVPNRETFDRLLTLTALGGYALRQAGEQRLADHYLDTRERAVLRGGYALRLREDQGGGPWLGTLNGLGGAAGALHEREELELAVPPGAAPDAWPAGPVRDLALRLAGGEPLAELFTLRQLRHKRSVMAQSEGAAPRAAAEFSLDQVTTTVAGHEQTAYELEIELRPDGAPADLDALGAALAAFELRPEPHSKFQRALALLDDAARDMPPEETAVRAPDAAEPAGQAEPSAGDKPERPKTPGVRADEPMAEAGRKVLRFHFERMLEKEDGTRDGGDPEDLHDMRVATRRQRAALRLFADYYKPKTVKRFGASLKELATLLGAVRDLDVQLEAAHAYQAGLPTPGAQGLQPVLDAWTSQRDAARIELLACLDGGDYKRFKKAFGKFVEKEGAGLAPSAGAEPRPSLVRQVLPGQLWVHYADVRAYEGVVPGAAVPVLHALRISGKRLRYALEFFREVLEPVSDGQIADAIEKVVALQDHLGDLHDADVTLGRLHDFLHDSGETRHSPESVMAVGAYLRVKQNRLRQLQRTAARPWRQVNGRRFRRILGRAVAGL